MDEPLIDSSAASPAEPVEEYRVINGWLVVAAGVCTCSGLDGTRHEVGCGWEPIRLVDDLLADLARLRAAEETLAAVGALADQIEAESLLPGASGRPVARAVVEDLRAALAEGASR